MAEEKKMEKKQKNRRNIGQWEMQWGVPALAFLIPVVILLTLFIINGIYPFGDRSFLFSDMYHQYMPFFSEFLHKLKAGEGLSYSYHVGIGSNFLALYVYYLASPMNWLALLFPEGHLMEFMSYLVVVKIGLSGLTFCFYLQKHFCTKDPAVLLFSCLYALSGYMAAYNWNIMWLDCVILVPVILLGLELLVREGKWKLYCVTLALSILTNYYISIMICIFIVLYFLVLLITEKRSLRILGRFTFASLLAGGLAAVLLIPEVCAILATDFGDVNFPDTLQSYFPVLDMLARHCMCVTTERGLEHWPNIYCGVVVFLLLPMYTLNERIPVRRRFCNLALAGFLLLSFNTNVLDFLWHGLNYPDSLPARQSFLYIFLVLIMCYDAYRNVEGTSPRQILYGYLAAIVFLLGCEKFIESEDFDTGIEILTLLFVTVYAVLLYFHRTRTGLTWKQLLGTFALAAVAAELSINTYNTSLGTTSRSAYLGQQDDYKALYELTEEREQGEFYRLEKFTRKTKNDGTLTGYPTASVFSSTMNSSVMDLYKRLGMRHSKVYYGYDGATAFTSALLNVKYLFGESEKYENSLFRLVDTSGDISLYECAAALPFGYVAPIGYDLPEGSADNAILVQNGLISDLGMKEELLERCDSTAAGDNVRITAKKAGHYYARVTASGTKKIDAIGGALESETFSDLKDEALLYLGYLEAGDSVTLTNGDDTDETPKISAEAYLLKEDVLHRALAVLSKQHLEQVHYDSTHVSGQLNLTERGRLILSIPYEKGWTVKLNGQETQPALFGGSLMAFDLEAGDYTLEMHYIPQGRDVGIAVSAVSVLIFALAMLSEKKLCPVISRKKASFAQKSSSQKQTDRSADA